MNEFGAPFAALKGCRLGKRSWMEKFGDWHSTDVVEGWTDGAEAQWVFTALKAGRYHVYADYECWAEADSEFEMAVAGMRWTFPAIYAAAGRIDECACVTCAWAWWTCRRDLAQLTVRGLGIEGDNALAVQKMVFEPSGVDLAGR